MASPDRRSSTGIDRRASMRTSMRLSIQQDGDEDEYALAAMGISDGFRPADMTAGPQSITSSVEIPRIPQQSIPPPRPSSISKPKGIDSFALRHDGQMGPILEQNMSAGSQSSMSPVLTRSTSVTSDSSSSYVRSESPYRGPLGPSQQYQMYPQETRLARTVSVATSMTGPVVERNYTGPNGPTHPYGMYPQNTVPESEADAAMVPPPIPVGFPGLNNNYQRRLGPDGEEIAGIIGPDGHTEELPPYTQYPDEAFARKNRPNLVAAVPGAGGMGLATRNPEFASRDDLNSPQSRQSTRSFSSDASTHQVNTAAMDASEKPELKKWQKMMRRKACGIVPIWALVLTGIVLVLFCIILGTVLAVLKPRGKKHGYRPGTSGDSQSAVVTTIMSTTFDATPLPTLPAGLPTLPTGSYSLPIQSASTVQSSCVDSQHSAAWSCQLPGPPPILEVTIKSIVGQESTGSNEIWIDMGNNSMPGVFTYGAQPPVVSNAQVLTLVTDSQDGSRGPAWFFQMPYNKLVVLRESDIIPYVSKRSSLNGADSFKRKGVAQSGDKPWFCYWNGTLLEAFIYVNMSSSSSQSVTTTAAATTSLPTATGTNTASATDSTSSYTQLYFLPNYPKVFKLEERRVPRGAQAITPYCVQQSIDGDGVASPYVNSTGQITTVYLNETDPDATSSVMGKRNYEDVLETRSWGVEERQSDQACACVWLAS